MRDLIRQKIVDSLALPIPSFTRRDVRLPGVPGKAVAVIGMRRTGKTTFLWQVLVDRLAQGTAREGLLTFSFEDERLAGMTAADLYLIVEEYYRLHPGLAGWRQNLVCRRKPEGASGAACHVRSSNTVWFSPATSRRTTALRATACVLWTDP